MMLVGCLSQAGGRQGPAGDDGQGELTLESTVTMGTPAAPARNATGGDGTVTITRDDGSYG